MDSYIKKGCQIDGVSTQATVMNSYMKIKKMICREDVKVYRLQLVQYARKYGIKPAAKEFGTTPKTVRKWVKRYQEDKELGMEDLPRPKLNCPYRIDPETEQRIIEFRKAHMRWGARTIKEALGLEYSQVAIHRVIKQAGLILPKRTKSKKRKDMAEMRAKAKAFTRIQVDIKYLTDIPEYELWRWDHKFPKYLIVARDYKTGASFCAYSHEKTPVATGLFMDLVLYALKGYGFRPETLTIQTDNGTEFTNPTSKKPSYFETIVKEKHGARHYMMEEQFFSCEKPDTTNDLIARTWAYQIWFNSYRKNRGRDDMTPEQIYPMELGEENIIHVIAPFVVDNSIKRTELVRDKGEYFWALPPRLSKNDFLIFLHFKTTSKKEQ